MRVIVVGAGAVGSYLAHRLSSEGQDVVVIEADEARASEMQDMLDCLVVTGNGSSPSVLAEAGTDHADLLIAVSSNDGANVLACHTAASLGVKRTVARIEDPGLREGLTGLEVDVVIDPGEMAAREIVSLVKQGGVSDLVQFGRGALVLVGGLVPRTSPLIGKELGQLRRERAEFDWVVTAVVRNGETIVARGDAVIEENDHVLLMVTERNVEAAVSMLGIEKHPVGRAVILGSTRLAELTAQYLAEEQVEVVLVDPDADRCRAAAEHLVAPLVICGDPTDPGVLGNLQLNGRDAVLALTGWDEVNILGCLVGKALGAATAVSRVNRISYVGLLAGVGIDATVSSRLAAANAILRFVRRGRIHSVATFKDTDAEAIEIEVEADAKGVDQSLLELPLPSGAIVGGVIREGDAFVPSGRTVIRPRDRLIIFARPDAITAVESLFVA